MYLRRLELKDAPLMLAWMHDKNVTDNLRTDFASKTLHDAEDFIRQSWEEGNSVHLAILQTQLKHIEESRAKNLLRPPQVAGDQNQPNKDWKG